MSDGAALRFEGGSPAWLAASLAAPACFVAAAYGELILSAPVIGPFLVIGVVVFGAPVTALPMAAAIWVGGRLGRRYDAMRRPVAWLAVGAAAGGVLGLLLPFAADAPWAGVPAGAAGAWIARRFVSWRA